MNAQYKTFISFNTYLGTYLGPESGSLQSEQVHICSPLLCSVHLRVLRLIVFIISWLVMRLAWPLSSTFLPSPLCTFFSISIWRVWDWSLFLLSIISLTKLRTVGGSRVIEPCTKASPASWSAPSLPFTEACPGQIHKAFSFWLSVMVLIQSL